MPKDLALSRDHFQVDNQPPLCHLIDLGSTNGTKVNGLRVGRVVLREGDEIEAGDSEFIVSFLERLRELGAFCHVRGLWRADPDRNQVGPIDGEDLGRLARRHDLALR